MADMEWTGIKREARARHGVLVGDVEDRLLVPTQDSPTIDQSKLR
jgi:hypothetical protein